MKYFRNYPWTLQLILFLIMTFTFLSSATAIALSLFHKLSGFQYADVSGITPESPFALIKAALGLQGFSSIFVYMLPPLVFAYLAHPRPATYLGLRKPGKPVQWLLTLLVMAGAMPVLVFIENLIGLIDFGASAKAAQAANDNMFQSLMVMPSFIDFLRLLFVLAVIPAIGEEFFFRGIFLRFASKRSRNLVFPVLFTAVVFSFSHANINGYLSIFLAGALLAVIYILTGSLWCSIIGHLFFNGIQIVLAYFGKNNDAIQTFLNNDRIPYAYVAGGAVLFAASFYLLLKNRTPLPPDWTSDFTAEELNTMSDEQRRKLF